MDVRVSLMQSYYKSWWRKLIYTILNWSRLYDLIVWAFDYWFMPVKVVNYDPPIPFVVPFTGPRNIHDRQLQHDGAVFYYSAKTGEVSSNTYAKSRHGWMIGHTIDVKRTTTKHDEVKD